MREAQAWVLSDFQAADFDAFRRASPIGSVEWRPFTAICGIMELFGVLVKHGLVREEVFFDLFGGIDVLWEAVAAALPGMRQAMDPKLYENFEALCHRATARP